MYLATTQLIFHHISVFGSVTLADKLPAGSSYLPPTAAQNGYGSPPQSSYGAADDYEYDDNLASYSEPQVI